MSRRKRYGGAEKKIFPPACLHCDSRGVLCSASQIYRNRPDLADRMMYRCPNCRDVYVGCHEYSERPLGRMGNAQVRDARKKTHAIFDPLWREHKFGDRGDAYEWLSRELAMAPQDVHIATADLELCRRIYELCLLAKAKEGFHFGMELT